VNKQHCKLFKSERCNLQNYIPTPAMSRGSPARPGCTLFRRVGQYEENRRTPWVSVSDFVRATRLLVSKGRHFRREDAERILSTCHLETMEGRHPGQMALTLEVAVSVTVVISVMATNIRDEAMGERNCQHRREMVYGGLARIVYHECQPGARGLTPMLTAVKAGTGS
jgi:hypothetical protein